MQKRIILALAQSGINGITAHTLPAAQAYKIVKFRSALNKAYEGIRESQQALLKDAGIENVDDFNKEFQELKAVSDPTAEQTERIKDMEAKDRRFGELYNELLNEDATLEGVKPMPYEDWHKLQIENAEKGEKKPDLLPAWVEDALEGILWEAPKED